MHWMEDGYVLSARAHGERSVLLELMTRAHGRHLGIVKGGKSRQLQPVLQPGNLVRAEWRARLDEHLGNYAVEAANLHAGRLMETRAGTFGIAYLASLLRLLPERDPHPEVFDALGPIVEHLGDAAVGPALMVRFELALLAELGFGLDLSECAATGTRDDLVYVSPKSARAVSREAGAPYRDRLLPLPAFLWASGPNASPTPQDIRDGFRLTGYFLARDVFDQRGLQEPEARRAYIAGVMG